MRDELLEVVALQKEYSAKNTPAMQRRGVLIRQLIPQELGRISDRLRAALGPHGEDLAFQGRDGTGPKTFIPWARFFSESRSPSPQRGWYCVYLFDAPGTGVYLWLGHGSTVFENGEFRPRPPDEVARLVAWGKGALEVVIRVHPELVQPMTLRGQTLGRAYEQSGVLARFYSAAAMPSDGQLFDDAVEFAGYLKLIYDAEVLGRAPTAPIPEAIEVERAASGQVEPKRGGQGFGLRPAERRAVEQRAMVMAKRHLEDLGWRVRDVSLTRPYDFECARVGEQLVVEVKGTTSVGEQVVVTRNEVAAQRAHHPNNALILVHSIQLARVPEPTATGGALQMISPWQIEDDRLQPLAFQYSIDK